MALELLPDVEPEAGGRAIGQPNKDSDEIVKPLRIPWGVMNSTYPGELFAGVSTLTAAWMAGLSRRSNDGVR